MVLSPSATCSSRRDGGLLQQAGGGWLVGGLSLWGALQAGRQVPVTEGWASSTSGSPFTCRQGDADGRLLPNKRFSIAAIPRGQTMDNEAVIKFFRCTRDLWCRLRLNPIHLKEVLWIWDNARSHEAQPVVEFFQSRNYLLSSRVPTVPTQTFTTHFCSSGWSLTWEKEILRTKMMLNGARCSGLES